MGLDNVNVEVIYKVDSDNDGNPDEEETNTLTITYVNEAKEEVATKYTGTYKNGEEYNVESPKVEGYVTETKTVTGTMGLDDVNVEVIYKVDSDNDGVADDEEINTLTIKYVNESKEEVATTYTHEYKNGEAYNVESPEVKGYVTETKTVTGTMGLDDVNVEVIYKIKKFTATIKDFNEETLGYIYNIPYGSSITSEQLEEYTNKLPIDITLGDGTVIEFTGTWSSNINNVTSDIVVTPIYSVKTSSATTVYELYPIHPIKDQGEGYDTSYYRVAFEDLVIKFNSSEELSNLIAEANRTDSQVNIAFGMENVFKYLTEESKAILQSLDTDEYYYDWFVLKYDRHDGWHLDGIRRSKTDDPVMDIEKYESQEYFSSDYIKIMADSTATDIQISINDDRYKRVSSDERWGYRYSYNRWSSLRTVKIKYSSNVTEKTYVKEFTYSNGKFTLVNTEVQG